MLCDQLTSHRMPKQQNMRRDPPPPIPNCLNDDAPMSHYTCAPTYAQAHRHSRIHVRTHRLGDQSPATISCRNTRKSMPTVFSLPQRRNVSTASLFFSSATTCSQRARIYRQNYDKRGQVECLKSSGVWWGGGMFFVQLHQSLCIRSVRKDHILKPYAIHAEWV